MPNRRFIPFLALLAGLAGCGADDDIPAGEPAGMGAGRPDTSGAESGVLGEVEPDAEEVLDGMGVMPMGTDPEDTVPAAGVPTDTSR